MNIKSFLVGCLAMVAISFAIVTPSLAFDTGVVIDQPAMDQVHFDSIAGVLTESDDFNWGNPASDNRILLAVDNSISALCRPGAAESYSRPGGFCDAVAVLKSMASGNSSGGPHCLVGEVPNPTPPPACIPEV